jgi:hypothetical protein
MTHPLSNELVRALNHIGDQVDHLTPPDLKILALALHAERERICVESNVVLRQMQQQRAEAIASFTQLLLCARQDLPLVRANYFDAVANLRRLSHE